VHPHTETRAQAQNCSGILRDIRFIQGNLDHGRGAFLLPGVVRMMCRRFIRCQTFLSSELPQGPLDALRDDRNSGNKYPLQPLVCRQHSTWLTDGDMSHGRRNPRGPAPG
jgi:hypothetical protein